MMEDAAAIGVPPIAVLCSETAGELHTVTAKLQLMQEVPDEHLHYIFNVESF